MQVILSFYVLGSGNAGDTSGWRMAYGTGTAPGCNAAVPGGTTTIGNQYTINDAGVAFPIVQTAAFSVAGLVPGTEYWFDVEVFDNSGNTWTYSLSQLSVIESP